MLFLYAQRPLAASFRRNFRDGHGPNVINIGEVIMCGFRYGVILFETIDNTKQKHDVLQFSAVIPQSFI